MKHTLHCRTTLPRPVDEAFSFFAEVGNLEQITPPELCFEIVSPRPIKMRAGALIDYRLRLFGLRFKWQTEITVWDPPWHFVDVQVKGPYRQWVHHHRFSGQGAETVMEDEVHYQLPLQPVGELAYPVIRLQLRRIFSYRTRVIQTLLA
jgi:ligand-binding SRPBCC domain-containing protein